MPLTTSRWKPLAVCCLFAASLLLGAACSAKSSGTAVPATTAQAQQPAHMTYAQVGVTWTQAPLYVAQAKGFFADEKLTVDMPLAGQSASSCQQVLAKAADIGECSLNDMIQADQNGGAHLVTFLNESATALQYSVMAKSSIKTWDDVKGKIVIVGGPKDNTVYYFHLMARAHGLKDSDYSFQYAGSTPARFAALKSGAVDVAMLTNPSDEQAVEAGYTRLDTLVPQYLNGSNYSGGGPVVDPEWAKAHSDVLTRFCVAWLKAVTWIYNPANKQEFFNVVSPKLNLPQQAFDTVYQNTVLKSKVWSPDGRLTDAGVEGVEKGLVDLGALKEPLPPPSKFYDMTYDAAALKLVKQG